ncbi:MAG: Yip1 family protein [Cyclobacteriaceae bacterium]
MNLIDRVKNMIVTPATEWEVVNSEQTDPTSLLKAYVLPLALAGAVATFIGYSFIGYSTFGVKVGGTISAGLNYAIISLLSVIIGYYLASYVIDMLAPSFKSEKDINKSAQLVAYANTPALVGALLSIIPSLAMIGGLFGLYGLYLLYIGLPVLKKTPVDQRVAYIIVSILVLLVIYFVVGMILSAIFTPIFGIRGAGLNYDF